MKAKMSEYLSRVKPLLKELVGLLCEKFEYAFVLGTDVCGTSFQVSSKLTTIRDEGHTERGFVARVYYEGQYFEYSFNRISHDEIAKIAQKIEEYAKVKQNGVSKFNYPLAEEQPLTQSFCGEFGIAIDAFNAEEKVKRLKAIVDKAFSLSDKLVEFYATMNNCHVSKIFISKKRDLEQSYVWSEAYLVAIARDGEITKDGFESFSGLKGLEVLDEMEANVNKPIDRAITLLKSKPIKPGMYDIIFGPSAAGMIAHEAFGHGVETDMFVKNRAKGSEYMNKRVASDKVTMRDGAKSANHVSSYLFDDEGTIGCDTVIIKNGILLSGLSDTLSAAKLGIKQTGNGKRESFRRKAYARMTNTFFEGGNDKLEDMIKSVKHGFLVERASSGMEDPKDWGIQCMMECAQEIVDGKLTDNYFSPIIMTGYVPDLLCSVSMVSPDVEIEGSGGCGKGSKEWVKVSCGGAYIKAKARLG